MDNSSANNTDLTQSISDWYKQQIVFISGGSGFLGKAFLFKLLQCGVPRIYVLIRSKKGRSPQLRLEDVLNEPIFEVLATKDPGFRSKVVAVGGDVTEIGLALSEQDRSRLQDEVTLVFHVAASVKFDDPLKKAMHHNLRSTRDMVELAKGMKYLKMFQHVSTAYSNCDKMMSASGKGVEEKIYERKIDWRKLIDFVDSTPDEVIDSIESKILGASPNTYIFTKHLAEAVVEDAAHSIPVIVTRPPVVISGWREPIPGWLDNLSSPVAMIGASGKGVLRLFLGTGNAPKAYIPVDTCVNCCLVATWREALVNNMNVMKSEIPVYNMEYCPISAGMLKTACFRVLETNPPYQPLWDTYFNTINSLNLFLLGHLLFHFIPGLLLDGILKFVFGAQPRLTRIYRKLYTVQLSLIPFVNTTDIFETVKYGELKKVIPDEEKEIFSLQMPKGEDELVAYLRDGETGLRILMGYPPLPSKQDFLQQKRLRWLDRACRVLLFLGVIWVFPFKVFFKLFELVTNSVLCDFNIDSDLHVLDL